MSTFLPCLLFFALVYTAVSSLGVDPVHDDENSNDGLELAIDQNILRLMDLRRAGWGWANTPAVVLGLQLSKQRSFFGRNFTLEKMKEELSDEFEETNIGKLSLYALAIQSVCENSRNYSGLNVILRIRRLLNRQWHYNGKRNQATPKDGWYKYGLAVQALCVNHVQIPKFQLLKVIRRQNDNGSYGSFALVDQTSQLLLALACTRHQRLYQSRRRTRRQIEAAIDRAVQFLLSTIRRDGSHTWIGNTYSTPGALLALTAARGNQSSSWSSEDTVNSLIAVPVNNEPEGAAAQRLPALSGRSVLNMRNGWECEEPVPVPNGYKPTYNPNGNLDCSHFQLNRFPGLDSFKDVSLSVQKTIGAQLSDPFDSTVIVKEARIENTLLQVMAQAQCDGDFTYKTTSSAFGPYVTSVGGLASNSTLRQYWSLVDVVKEESLPVGVGQYIPSHNGHILFQLKTY